MRTARRTNDSEEEINPVPPLQALPGNPLIEDQAETNL
jgi:hypothetical protein